MRKNSEEKTFATYVSNRNFCIIKWMCHFIFSIILIKFVVNIKEYLIIHFTFPYVSTMGSVNSTGLFTHSLSRTLLLFSHSSTALSTLFFLSSSCFHILSFLLALLMRNNSVCSYWNEVQLLSAWANFVLMYKAFHEIFTTLKNIKYSAIINAPFHLNLPCKLANTSETIREMLY